MSIGPGGPAAPEPAPFEPDLRAGQLKQRSVRGGLGMVLAKGATHSVRLAAMLLLARVLTPADFGLLAMVVSAIALGNVFRDMGLSAATLQRKDLSAQQVSTMFWMNLAFGLGVTGLVAAGAPLVAIFYGDPRVLGVTLALAASFTLNGLGTQHQALLRRQLRFAELARIMILTTGISASVAVWLALHGASYWALVAYTLVDDLVGAALAWHYARWVPSRPRFDASTREMLSFGGYLVVYALLGFFARNLHNLLMGRWYGPAAVGLFNRAYMFIQLLQSYTSGATQTVALPALTRLEASSPRFRAYYLTNLRIVSLASAPAAAFAVLFAGDVIHVLFGPQWAGSAPVLAWLSAGMLVQPLLHSTGLLFLARGHSRQMMIWGAYGWTLMTVCMVAGVPFGIEGVAIGYAVSLGLLAWPNVAYAVRGTAVTVGDAVRAWGPGTLTALAAAAPAWMLAVALAEASPYVRVFPVGVLFIVTYVVLLLTVSGQRDLIFEIAHQFRRRASAA